MQFKTSTPPGKLVTDILVTGLTGDNLGEYNGYEGNMGIREGDLDNVTGVTVVRGGGCIFCVQWGR